MKRRAMISAAAACTMALSIAVAPIPPAHAAPKPYAVTVNGTAWNNSQDYWTTRLTLKPWYLFDQPILGITSGTLTFYGYKTRTDMQCLFGLAWDVHISDTPPRSMSFKCLWLGSTSVFNGSWTWAGPSGGVGTLMAADGTEPGGYLFMDTGGYDPRPQEDVYIQVTF